MIDSIAATSLLGSRPIPRSYYCKNVYCNRKGIDLCRQFISLKIFVSDPFPFPFLRLRANPRTRSLIKSQAMELTRREAYGFRREQIPRDFRHGMGMESAVDYKPGMWPPENKADNPSLNNPLLRQERMGCGWLTAVFEWDGVLIEDNPDLEKNAWLALSDEEGKSPPPAFVLRRIEGMKNEQAIAEVLCWSRDPSELRRMASRKEEIYQSLHGGVYRLRPGSQEFITLLMQYKVPTALVSTRPRKYLDAAIDAIGINGIFDVIVAAEDVHRGKPDPEMFMYAAQLLQFIPERCIVFGNSNRTIEAAHDARMKCVAVASKHPVYELSAADLVVKSLNELSMVDLKNLAGVELPEFGLEMEMEVEEEDDWGAPSTVGVDDGFW
ncbi:5-amino-6-(5-phospho-D-ribitylamino)uracil phosphatase, chloroplastic-like [Andrographis paniculata]|uniref:5-amino-6-(5-phospho-D-ribitylamino)uracil phosphatase, chloroplastic-like n=1 Tax=Andrographis paniculata TaxID=175694 RepID=UPI0021E97A07|nr:5-amino-6-(5-phospho-D-ribitylamino)uracil phosphatase, chloroplastic-like [Andrographis paniculata]